MAFKRLHSNSRGNSHRLTLASRLTTFILIFVLVIFLSVVGIVAYFMTKIPAPDELSNRDLASATKIYDRNGDLLYDIFKDENRTPVTLVDIPKSMQEATISIEDKNFYQEQGFSVTGILRSFFMLIIHRQVEGGGSTLTQQLVKNALLTSDPTVTRKIKELILAIQVEHAYTKDQILEMYLNEIPYGGTAYGVEAAANLYFGKHAKDLDLAESSMLAGLPQAPSTYSPYGTHPDLAKARQKEVLDSMVANGYITKDQDTQAYNEQLTYRTSKDEVGFKAPHFVLYVKKLLEEQFGTKMVEEGGLRVTTSLDYPLQQQAENVVKTEVDKLKNYKVGNGAAVVMDPKTGEILAMVGSKDFFATDYDGQVNVTTSLRQPGSSTKPIMYAEALTKNYTASTVLEDTKTDFPGGADGKTYYEPHDYDFKYRGPIQMRYALGNSLNIPAVKMLARVGIKDTMSLAYQMGLANWEPTDDNVNSVGLSLVLGGREVTLLDLVSAYSVFADQGVKKDPVAILKVTDANGKVLFENQPSEGRKILDPGVSFIVSDMLSDNGARTMVFGPYSTLVVPGHNVAVKTGTTDDKRDNWTVGYTPSRVAGVWIGNNDDTPMDNRVESGAEGASGVWNKLMKVVLQKMPNEQFQKPDDVVQMDIDGLMGGLPHDGSPTRKEYFINGTQPTAVSSAYQNRKVCDNNPHRLASDNEPGTNKDVVVLSEDDPTGANLWQKGIDDWVLTAANPMYIGTAVGCSGIPSYSGGSGGVISITNISNGANVPKVFDVLANVNSPAGVKNVTWTVDGAQKSVETSSPYALHVEFPDGDHSSHTITATLTDNSGATYTSSVGVTVSL